MSDSPFSLAGRVAIVTGARRGIGRAIALAMANAGADLSICDQEVDDGDLQKVADEVSKMGRRCITSQVNVTLRTDVEKLVQDTVTRLGTIDILANNAAIETKTPLFETSDEEWHTVMDVNCKSIITCSKAVSGVMQEKKRGAIVNTASAAGFKAFATRNVYNISKAGVIMLTRLLARQLGGEGIRVNAVAPAVVRSWMARGLTGDPDKLAKEERRIPLKRICEPEEIANPVVFLASDAASYITGQILYVDGGSLT